MSVITSRAFKLGFLLFIAVYLLFLIVSRTPAIWTAWFIHSSAPNVWLSGVDGTMWRGKAGAVQVDIGESIVPFGELRWQLKPLSLVTLSPCLSFSTRMSGQTMDGEFCQSITGMSEIKDFLLEAPISVIKDILPVEAEGRISLQVASSRFDSKAKVEELDARFTWQSARVNTGDQWLSLGAFAASAKQDGKGGASAKIFDLEGPYKSDVEGSWMMTEGWSVRGIVNPQPGASDLVIQGLSLIGEDLGEGEGYRVQWP